MRYHRPITFLVFLVFFSCVPKAFLLEQPKLVSVYFERKIKKLENNRSRSIEHERLLIKTRVEYGFGIIMEQADRLIDDNYLEGLNEYKKANIIFNEAKDSGISIMSDRYPEFNTWLKKDAQIDFKQEDVSDMYWLAASIGGAIGSSRGNPFELINLPYVGRLLNKCIQIDSEWNHGSLYSAMMSFTTTRSDLSETMLRDTVDHYFNKTISSSNGMDAGPYLTYAESIHKTFQERKDFVDKLNYVLEMDIIPNSDHELSNLIAKSRAKWLLTKTDEYFLE
ncbi:MAG: TRAP transporter TatT component family protein [Candidatus Marinimicrobia bacterium]|nr:TRAP transporter TatT component family protein [Candidatus Neomarinimicrobiota bacterium]